MANLVDKYISTQVLADYKGLQFTHLNVRSIYPKIDEVRHKLLTTSMDIVCFTETWLTDNISSNMIDINGFDILRNDRIDKRGGGTCIYIKHRIYYAVCLPNLSQSDVEIQSITLLGNDNSTQSFKPIVVILIYRPPHGNSHRALDQIKAYISSVPEISKKELVILGDLNWDYIDNKGAGWRCLNELETEFGINQIITCPTRCCPIKSSLIDVILIT